MIWNRVHLGLQHLVVQRFDVERFNSERQVSGQHRVHVHSADNSSNKQRLEHVHPRRLRVASIVILGFEKKNAKVFAM